MRENLEQILDGVVKAMEEVSDRIVEGNVRHEELSAVPGQVECDAIAGHGVVALYALADACPRCGAAV